jgi:hypothetical protein
MVQIKGTGTKLRLPDSRCRGAQTWAFGCPDGVDRFVTIPNWKWNVWLWPAGQALYPEQVADAWRFAQIFARRHPAAEVFADKLIRNVDTVYLRPEFRADNDNFPPVNTGRRDLCDRPPPRWGKGGVSSVFKRHAGRATRSPGLRSGPP